MVKVYSADAVDFDNTHIAEVEPLTGESYEKINGLYTLTFECPFSMLKSWCWIPSLK